ncbi:MAG: penicillin-binding protein 1A [Clostridiales bacterium]|jgi:1A family penicillin-binding protein|nr:penicillin-binding protein 1A [Clostridiales bacterium]
MRRITRLTIITVLVLAVFAVGSLGFLAYTVAGMDEIPDVEIPLTTTFYDRNNEVITTRFEQNRFEVSLNEVPDFLAEAFLAVEDHRFYSHFGIDLQGLFRAAYRNVRERRFAEGGSTITQQLAKNLFLTHEKTLTRKSQELLLTVQLERKFSKDEILESYLNTIYFGHSAYGVEAAARTYFGKSVGDLTLAESAMLAGIPRGPAFYSPWINFESAKRRQNTVLSRMVEQGFITPGEKEDALTQEIVLQDRTAVRAERQTGAYFIDYLIQRELAILFPNEPEIVNRGGLHVYTTLDKGMQLAAENSAASLLPAQTTENGQPQVAIVAMDPENGAVRALVGGRDFRTSQFNRAIPPQQKGQARGRSAGSAFKPFTFAAALENGYTPATVHLSEPVSYQIPGLTDPYEPSEYGGRFYGPLTIRQALARSSNIVAIKTHMDIGPQKTAEMANRLGIESNLSAVASLPLGTSNVIPLEMAAAYAPFANQGVRVTPQFITRVTDSGGRTLYEFQPERRLVLDPRVAYLMTDMMRDVLRPGGTGSSLGPLLNRPAAAKTGTSEDHRDAYIVGYTPTLVTAVWIGNDDNSTLGWGQTGSRIAGPIWVSFMREALKNTAPQDFVRPEGIVSALICPETGLLHNPQCSLTPINELFIAGTEPTEMCRWPLCPHCPPEQQWHWNGGWFRRSR